MNTRIIVVGAGISGIYTSILLKQQLNNVEVLVLESNSTPLKKLLSTGNGRCNLSNVNMNVSFYDSDDSTLVNQLIYDFDIYELNDLGLQLVNFSNLYYPKSEQALSVKRILLNKAESLGVKVICDTHVKSITPSSKYIIHTDLKDYKADYCILALGSPASKLSGNDFDRYDLLKKLNLKVVDVSSSLVSLNTKKVYPFKGVRVKGIVKLYENNHLIHAEKGELLFTDYGISGISVMQLSHFINDNKKYQVTLDLYEDLDEQSLNQLIVNLSKQSDYYLDGLVNTKIAEWMYKHLQIREMAHFLKQLTFEIKSKRTIEYAQVCRGGLSLQEVNEHLEIKAYPHLYCIGEQLNVTGMCGGYNIHFALSCAKAVSKAIIGELC